MSRLVRLIACSSSGELLGGLPEFRVESSGWPDVQPVVEGARTAFGIEVVILRLLSADSATPTIGGAVSYLAEVVGDLPPAIAVGRVDPGVLGGDQPLRAPWARPGGVATTIAWADTVLAALDRPRTGAAIQVKSWNLSSALRLPTAAGDVWCKSVPRFMTDEGAILAHACRAGPRARPAPAWLGPWVEDGVARTCPR